MSKEIANEYNILKIIVRTKQRLTKQCLNLAIKWFLLILIKISKKSRNILLFHDETNSFYLPTQICKKNHIQSLSVRKSIGDKMYEPMTKSFRSFFYGCSSRGCPFSSPVVDFHWNYLPKPFLILPSICWRLVDLHSYAYEWQRRSYS